MSWTVGFVALVVAYRLQLCPALHPPCRALRATRINNVGTDLMILRIVQEKHCAHCINDDTSLSQFRIEETQMVPY